MKMHSARFSNRRLLLGLAALGVVLAHESDARAEADTFGLGSGRNGALVVTSAAGQVINTYAPVTAAVAAGDQTITVGTAHGAAAAFTAGELVMLLQTRGGFATPLVSGSATTIALTSATRTGRYELARVALVVGSEITLTHPTVDAFDALDTQIVSVPEYTTVTVDAAAKLTAAAWDSVTGTGGVLAFLATGAVANAGSLDVSSTGFGGGVRITSPTVTGCAAQDGTPGAGGAANGGAHKGEGLDPTGFSEVTTYAGAVPHQFGRGNVGNGGGGGDCFNAGGGGGGNGGAGGQGGDSNGSSDVRRAVGGHGGVLASYDPTINLVLGGGGGAGEDDDGVGGRGGVGGGVVWMRADSLTGAGTLDADGAAGASAGVPMNPIYADGGGGGGAGGGVFASLHGNATCGGITARGGKGGNALPATPGFSYGPGGGGGGGRVRVAAAGGTCTAVVTSGAPGVTTGNNAWGAVAGGAGATTTTTAFTTTSCDVVTGKCGGCVTDTFCPAATPTCVTTAGATQWTCVSLVGPMGDGGTEGGVGDGGDGGDGGTRGDAGDGGSDADGGDGGPSGEGGIIDTPGEIPAPIEGSSLEGGGISCNTAPASTSSVLTLVGLAGLVGLFVRRKQRRGPPA